MPFNKCESRDHPSSETKAHTLLNGFVFSTTDIFVFLLYEMRYNSLAHDAIAYCSVLFRHNRDSECCTFVTGLNVITLTVRVIGPCR